MNTCEACGKPIAIFNVDKMRGVIGLTMGWVHVNRRGNPKRWVNHAPVVTE